MILVFNWCFLLFRFMLYIYQQGNPLARGLLASVTVLQLGERTKFMIGLSALSRIWMAERFPFSFRICSTLLIPKTFLVRQLDSTQLLLSTPIHFSASKLTSRSRISLLMSPGCHLSLYIGIILNFYESSDSTLTHVRYLQS